MYYYIYAAPDRCLGPWGHGPGAAPPRGGIPFGNNFMFQSKMEILRTSKFQSVLYMSPCDIYSLLSSMFENKKVWEHLVPAKNYLKLENRVNFQIWGFTTNSYDFASNPIIAHSRPSNPALTVPCHGIMAAAPKLIRNNVKWFHMCPHRSSDRADIAKHCIVDSSSVSFKLSHEVHPRK